MSTPIRLSADFSAETLQARRKRHDIVNAIIEKKKTTFMRLRETSCNPDFKLEVSV